jgi:hypothetical protein
MPGFSDAVEKKILDHLTGKTAYASPGPLYLALTTVAVVDSDTAASITEASYTGYSRKQIPAADWTAASGTNSTVSNGVLETFPSCTAGTSTIIGWALCSSASGAGDVIAYGTCASTVISTTQTPATVPVGALSISLD